jgi:protein phosphatase
MGGENGGEVASSMAADIIEKAVKNGFRQGMPLDEIKSLLVSAVEEANSAVYSRSQADKGLSGMGTTVVAAVISSGLACIASAGDSRAYLISGGEIRQVTRDHSVVQIYYEQGKITEDEIMTHPERHYITRALGVDWYIETDINELALKSGDKLLICSDGLSGFLRKEEILACIAVSASQFAPESLIFRALDRRSTDNITVVLADVVSA